MQHATDELQDGRADRDSAARSSSSCARWHSTHWCVGATAA